jgi:hypothetical protein
MKRGRPSRRELSYEEFDAKHADELSALAESFGWRSQSEFESKTLGDALRFRGHALPDWAREFKRTPLCTLLAAAGRENCPEGFALLLILSFGSMGIRIPAGVLTELRGKPGRPYTTAAVYTKWIELGKPALNLPKLASAIYGDAFKRADAAGRRRMIDRCRKTVGRHQPKSGNN